MAYNIRKNWVSSLDLIKSNPIVLFPFIIGAFFEGLALELIYFSARRPLSFIVGPIIRKFFGEGFNHYPAHLLLLPKLFYYAQLVIYASVGIFLMAIAVNMVKNIRMKLPVKTAALVKNALKRYLSFFVFAVIMVALMFLLKKADTFIYVKAMRFLSRFMPQIVNKLFVIGLSLFLFFSNIILQVFFVLVVPIMVIQKKSLLKALGRSIYLSLRNFFSILALIILPFLLYLPITLIKGGSGVLIDKTFPEINLYLAGAGIIIAVFIECFITVCASQFLLDKEKNIVIAGEGKTKASK